MTAIDRGAPAYPFIRNDGDVFPMALNENLDLMNLKTAIFIGVGTLPMKKHIGSQLSRILFMNDDITRATLIKRYVYDATKMFDINVYIHDVLSHDVEDKENEVYIEIIYEDVHAIKPKTVSFTMSRGLLE